MCKELVKIGKYFTGLDGFFWNQKSIYGALLEAWSSNLLLGLIKDEISNLSGLIVHDCRKGITQSYLLVQIRLPDIET